MEVVNIYILFIATLSVVEILAMRMNLLPGPGYSLKVNAFQFLSISFIRKSLALRTNRKLKLEIDDFFLYVSLVFTLLLVPFLVVKNSTLLMPDVLLKFLTFMFILLQISIFDMKKSEFLLGSMRVTFSISILFLGIENLIVGHLFVFLFGATLSSILGPFSNDRAANQDLFKKLSFTSLLILGLSIFYELGLLIELINQAFTLFGYSLLLIGIIRFFNGVDTRNIMSNNLFRMLFYMVLTLGVVWS